MKNKRKFIYSLIIIAVLLLLINVFLSLVGSDKPVYTNKSVPKKIITTKFLQVLSDFNIDDLWIKKKKIKSSKYDSVNYKYVVKIPRAVPIPLVLKDLNEKLIKHRANIVSSEENINGKTKLIIKSGNYTKLICDFVYDKNLKRGFSNIAFLLINGEELNEEELSNLLAHPIKFGVVLPLEIESQLKAEKIKEGNKDYFIELSDDSDNILFELSDDTNIKEFNLHLKKIVSMFNSPKVFFTNKNTSGFSKNTEKYINENLKKRGRKVISINSFIFLKGESRADLLSLLAFHLNRLKAGDKKVFRIEYEDFLNIEEELNNYTKKGNRIVLPNQLL